MDKQKRALEIEQHRVNWGMIRKRKVQKIVSRKQDATDRLQEYIRTPGCELFNRKAAELAAEVVQCETMLRYL